MMFTKDLYTRFSAMVAAWVSMRPLKKFFGLTPEGFKEKAKPYVDALEELELLSKQWDRALSKRDQAARDLQKVIEGVIQSVGGDPEETNNGELYAAMGYTPKDQRASGLVRAATAAKRAQGGAS
jgi:hypothetical protein